MSGSHFSRLCGLIFSASMIRFARRTISGLIIVILGALWESYSWNMMCHIVFSEHDEFCSENDIRPNNRGFGSIVAVFVEYEVSYSFSASMVSFAHRTISGLIIVILGALWESFS